ncbi:FAD-binding oxidoreductase [Panacibacter ginsenosidivorans]|uniref:FAD-binding oxidoreductase n=1 Tax=Panacibacter ginsenosidivorans TaxID=1813871 RepID=A0A5B8VEC2_9BACT|nr:FAD-dependent oxidoreductase [Panacibacter ginsenosidivorans]QEC69672.1 FAD-binding oxidoreductase [Panacibacter ginsenosidivorans]
MKVDYLIIGQGICGTFLSYYLKQQDKTVLVIDELQPFSSTKVASGVINPVTGRRVVTTWMIETLLPFAWESYSSIGKELNETIIEQKNTISFAPSYQMKETYEKRMSEKDSYINSAGDNQQYKTFFNYLFGCYSIEPTYLINLHPLLKGWRKKLFDSDGLLEESFDISMLGVHEDHVTYKNITAQKVIFCNGISTFEYTYWQNLPYVYNKGQALIADIPGLPQTNIYKYGALSAVPWYDGLWWVGSSYENEFETTEPTAVFREGMIKELNSILNIPFTIIDQVASLRPATLERRPFVGLHPQHNSIGIFNGMGTKGCSLAPYFAKQFADHLTHNQPLDALADIKRFNRILMEK